jgi:hypothetical protein
MLMVNQQADDQDYDYDNRINRHLSRCKEVLSQNDYELVRNAVFKHYIIIKYAKFSD